MMYFYGNRMNSKLDAIKRSGGRSSGGRGQAGGSSAALESLAQESFGESHLQSLMHINIMDWIHVIPTGGKLIDSRFSVHK